MNDAKQNILKRTNDDPITTNRLALFSSLLFAALAAATVTSKGQSNLVEFVWTSQAGGGNFATGTSLALDARGNVYATGGFTGTTLFGNTTLTNDRGGYADLFVAKYDSEGSLSWVTRVEAEISSAGRAIKVDGEGGAFVTGSFQGATRFGTTILTNAANPQAFLAKIDAQGRFVWVARGQSIDSLGVGGSAAYGIALDPSSNVYITGFFENGDVVFGGTNKVSKVGGFLAKFDRNGNSLWSRQIGKDIGSYSWDVATDSLGNSYVTGWFEPAVLEIGGISLTNSVPDLRVLFIAKLDPDGNGLWATASGIPIGVRDAYARGHRVVADAQRNVFVAGIFRSSMVLGGTTLTANTEKADIFIAKFDRAGSPVWLRQLGAKAKANDDLPLGLAVDLSGDAHIAGRFGDKIFLGKYSSNGDLIWFKPVSSSAPSQGSGIAVDDKQNIFITGRFTGSAVFAGNFISKGAGDFFVGMLTELPPVSVFLDNQWITKSVVVKPGSTKVAIQTTYPNGSLFYSLDGSSPTFASLAYSAPFLLTNSATVRVLAYSADFAKSAQSEPIEVKIIPTFKITALETGGGRVEVTPAMDRYVLGSEIVARAVSSNGWSFIRWTGDATGDGESVTMAVNTNKSIGAIFGTPLTTTVSGEGTININPTLSLYPFGSTVRLWAVPKPGFYFGAWGNAARGSTNPLLIQITDARPSVAALFALLGSEQVTLTAVVDGDGQISVEPPANVYTRGQVVTLTAKPDGDKEFLLWTGDMMSSVNPTSLRLDSSKSVRGHFGRRPVITAARFDSNGRFFASILSDIGRIVQIESSADCLTWLPVVLLTNTVGTLGFSDRAQIDSSHFYRARLMLK